MQTRFLKPEDHREIAAASHHVTVDGKPFAQLEPEFASKRVGEFRYSARHIERLIAFYTVALAGLHEAQLETVKDQNGDFSLTVAGQHVVLECSTLISRESSEFQGFIDTLNVEINSWILSEDDISQRLTGKFAELVIETYPTPDKYVEVRSEVRRLIEHSNLSASESEIERVDATFPHLQELSAKLIKTPARGLSHFAVREPPRWFDTADSQRLFYSRLNAKRRQFQARSDERNELWLSLYFTEKALYLPETLERISQRMQQMTAKDIKPFDRVFVGDSRMMLEIRQ